MLVNKLVNILFFWFFWPSNYIDDWHDEMLKSVLIGLIVNAFFIIIYLVLRYRRERERKKIWITFAITMIINLICIILNAIKINSEMLTDSYRAVYIINFMVAVAVWDIIMFYLASFISGAKKYFCRINEYLIKVK